MDNTRIVDEESIPLVEDKDRDHDDYNTPNTSRVDETSFTEHDPTKATSTLQLRQNVKRDKITAMNLTGDPGLADMDQFMIKKKKTGNTDLLFLDGDNHWQSLTNKRTGEFLAAKTFMLRHDRHLKMLTLTCNNFLGLTRPYKAYRVNS